MGMIRFTIALAALLATPAPILAAPLSTGEIAEIDRIVAREMARTQVPSVSIAVVRDGEIALAKSYGMASPTLKSTPDLPYQIASISKQFTAMALLMLEDEGKLDLDDPVSKYVPQVTGGGQITLRQLLDHTSGIRDYWPQDFAFPAMAKPVVPAAIVERWATKPLDFDPGTQWQYTNTAYVIAGMVVEKVSGQPLLTFIKQRIFTPLGMTSVVSQDDAIGPRFPVGYGRAALGPVRAEPPAARGWLYAAGELSMSPSDLAKWNIARINRSLVPADDWQAQESTTHLKDGSDTSYGLGVTVSKAGDQTVVSHGGESVGFLSDNRVFLEKRAAVTVLSNSWSGGAHAAIAQAIAQRLVATPAETGPNAPQAKVERLYGLLRSGQVDPALLTPNASYFFTPQRIADYGASLGPLGEPIEISPAGSAIDRGGFVIQSYTVRYNDRSLRLSTFLEPGPDGRIEQFLVTPAR